MKKKRVIPILLHKEGWLVQSKNFSEYKKLGNAQKAVQRLSEWDSDELIYLDISKNETYTTNRSDTAAPEYQDLGELLGEVSKVARMPITIGGGIKTLNDIEVRLRAGADKISINRAAITDPSLIGLASREFGRQCIVVSIDYEEFGDERHLHVDNKNMSNGNPKSALEWLLKVEELGAGEILLNSVSRDGMKSGYDISFLAKVADTLNIPVIACGGAGNWEHLAEVLTETNVDAVAAANIFHFQDQSVYLARRYLASKGLPVRPPSIQIRNRLN
jgi:imidazole glycerol-phosphate synthase subunit HisF